MKYSWQHAVKNIARIVLNFNIITFNQLHRGLISLCSKMRNDFLPPNVGDNSRNYKSFVYLYMTVKEIRTRIQDLIATIPEENLEEIYKFLKDVKNVPSARIKRSKSLSNILSEDGELLKRLAQ